MLVRAMHVRTWVTSSLMLAACGSRATDSQKPKPLANTTVSSGVRIAVALYERLSLVDVMPGGSHVVRSAKVASRIAALDWLGDDPIVLLQRGSVDSCGLPEEAFPDHATYVAANRVCVADARHDGTIGRLTAKGFVPYPPLSASTWELLKAPKDAEPCTTECWSLDVIGDQVWQGHCKWVFSADGRDLCDEWAYARLDVPGPATKKLPTVPASASAVDDEPTSSPLAAPAGIAVAFDPVTPRPRYDGDEPESQLQLTCALGDAAPTVYPAKLEDLDAGMSRELTWLATDPPIFAAWHRHDGFEMTEELVIFERCKRMSYEQIVPGGDGVVALVGSDRVEIRRNGTLVGSTDGGTIVSFAPSRASGNR